MSQLLRLRAYFEITCSEYEGIDAIRDALLAGQAVSRKDCEMKIQLIAHPLFVITCSCLDRDAGMDAIAEAMRAMKDSIEASDGEFMKKSATALVGPGMGIEDFSNGECCDSRSDCCEEDAMATEQELAAMMAKDLKDEAWVDIDDDD